MKTPAVNAARRWKRRALFLVLAAAAAAAAVYFGQRRLAFLSAPPPARETAETGAGMRLERIHQTATRDGRTEWALDAETAHYLPAEKKVLLGGVSVLYHLKDGGTVRLTADKGAVFTDSNDLQAFGNVVVSNDRYRLETQAIDYAHASRQIHSRSPVKITHETAEITADALELDLGANRLALDGHVRLVTSGAAGRGGDS
jgi:LPS export ABC transporter protein LptC